MAHFSLSQIIIYLSLLFLHMCFNKLFPEVCYAYRCSQVFVSLVIMLTTSVVAITYLFVLPTIFSTYPVHWVVWHFCCGHWLLIMLVFHYYKATTTSPGHPPKVKGLFV